MLKKILILFIIFLTNFTSFFAGSSEGINLYEKAYHLEKNYPLFSIPIYEKLLHSSSSKDVRRIASIRLYFLYVKYKKYPELLDLYSKYGSIIRLNKEHQTNLQEMYKSYHITSAQFYEIYPLLRNPNEENRALILEILTAQNSTKLLEFVYSIWNQMGNFEELRTLLFYLPETIAKPSLKMAILVKTEDASTADVITEYLENDNLTNIERSDAIYLYGQYLKSLKYYTESIQNFEASGNIERKERSKKESAKSYIAMGKIQTACKLGSSHFQFSSESDTVLQIVCNPSSFKDLNRDLKLSWEILSTREQEDFYKNAIDWVYNR